MNGSAACAPVHCSCRAWTVCAADASHRRRRGRARSPRSPTPQPLTGVIEGLKSGNGLRQARILGALLSASAKAAYDSTELPEALVPMPLTRRRLRQRGFNQAALLARSTARLLGLPSLPRHLVRVRNTPPQRSLPRSARLTNVRRAFAVKRPITYRRIALVDDVSTTGATAHAASTALLAGGAEEVHVWVAAKAL